MLQSRRRRSSVGAHRARCWWRRRQADQHSRWARSRRGGEMTVSRRSRDRLARSRITVHLARAHLLYGNGCAGSAVAAKPASSCTRPTTCSAASAPRDSASGPGTSCAPPARPSRGYRAIAHDRRGGGRSGQTWDGNDLDTYADDLAELMQALDLDDAVLVGHSTGGGEVAATSAATAPPASPRPCCSRTPSPWPPTTARSPKSWCPGAAAHRALSAIRCRVLLGTWSVSSH
jgi:hypothetical protein